MHRFLSRSDEGAGLTRCATGGRRKRTLCSTLRRTTESNAVRANDFVAAVKNLGIVRAKIFLSLGKLVRNKLTHQPV